MENAVVPMQKWKAVTKLGFFCTCMHLVLTALKYAPRRLLY